MLTIEMENSSPLSCICKVQQPGFISCSRIPTSKTKLPQFHCRHSFCPCLASSASPLACQTTPGNLIRRPFTIHEGKAREKVTRIVFDFRIFGPSSLLCPNDLSCFLFRRHRGFFSPRLLRLYLSRVFITSRYRNSRSLNLCPSSLLPPSVLSYYDYIYLAYYLKTSSSRYHYQNSRSLIQSSKVSADEVGDSRVK